MEDSLVKLCGDEVAHAKYKQLYGDKPSDRSKAAKWEHERVVFFLAWDSCKRVMKKSMEEELKISIKELLETYSDLQLTIEVMGVTFVNAKILDELRV